MTAVDPLGNPVGIDEPRSRAALDDFVEGFLACETRVLRILDAAQHDDAPIVQACAAMLHMFAESRAAAAQARRFIERARRRIDADPTAATERERRFVEAIRLWIDGDVAGAIALHDEQVRLAPRDLVSVKLGQYHRFNLGDAPGMLRLALPALRASADVPWIHGMAAFGFEQCHLLTEAEAAARRGIAMRRKEPWAQHALAHVMLTRGRIDEGCAFMQEASGTWVGLNSFMLTHNWWHLALFLIEQDRLDDALALYDARVWGVAKDYSQDQVGAVSLLARLELAGADVGDRWQELGGWLAARIDDHVQPFLAMQYLYGLARAGRPDADRMLASIESFASQAAGASRDAWQQVCVPACRGLLAHARGDHAAALAGLGLVLPRLAEIGGSHAQRDLFEQIWLDAMCRAGRWVGVQQVLQPHSRAQPESRRIARLLAAAWRQLDVPRFAC